MESVYDFCRAYVEPTGSGYVGDGQSYDQNLEWPMLYWLQDDYSQDNDTDNTDNTETFSFFHFLDPAPLTQPQHSQEHIFVPLQFPDHVLPTQPQQSQEQTPEPHKSAPVKRFRCECGHMFEYEKDLRRHSKSKHQVEGSPVFKCRCGKTDTRKDNHKRHVQKCTKQCAENCYTCECGREYANFNEYLGGKCACTRDS
ncbi:hypothetical protein F5X97DRAFT_125514 [Nemania serpens]|nr:hypothetical protein F5X97DRAFT_125514 [Nemania serpens]